jgi:general secretion pathway protein N
MRLTGIVTEPDHHLAIFAVNGAKPLRVTEGEAVSGWRIESITPREVSLSGPGGTKTLEPKLDPNLVQQAPPAPPANPAARQPAQPQPPQLINVPQRPAIPPRLPVRPPLRPQLRPPPGRVQQ